MTLVPFLRSGLLALALAALTACGAPERPQPATLPQPEAIYRSVAQAGTLRLLEGGRTAFGQQVPDGRLWLLDAASGHYRLLTPDALFPEPFFAAGGLLLPDGAGAIVKVNFSGDGDNLYRLSLDGQEAIFLTDAQALGLSSIDEYSFSLSPEGRLLFAGSSVVVDEAAADGFYERRGRYALELKALH